MIVSWKGSDDKSGQGVEKQRHYSANKGPYSRGYGLPRGHTQLWELDHKEGRMPKNWCLQTVVLERTPQSPLRAKRWNQSIWQKINPEYSLEVLMLKLKLQYFGHMMWTDESWKVSDARKDWGQKKRVSKDEMAGQCYWCNEHELGRTPGDDEGRGGLVCCSPWGHKESDMIGWLNNNKGKDKRIFPDDKPGVPGGMGERYCENDRRINSESE